MVYPRKRWIRPAPTLALLFHDAPLAYKGDTLGGSCADHDGFHHGRHTAHPTLPYNDEACTDASAPVRGLDNELDCSQRGQYTRCLTIGAHMLPLGVVIVHVLKSHGHLAIH